MSEQMVGIEGPNRSGAMTAAMGEVRDGFGLWAGFRRGGLPRGTGPRGGYNGLVQFGFLGQTPHGLCVSGRWGFCERYELKIDYITMDQECTWSQYMVKILLYGILYLYILCIDTR